MNFNDFTLQTTLFLMIFLILFVTSFGIIFWWVLASILPSCWKPFGINCHVSGCLFFHVFLDGIFSKFEPKMVPKLDTWRDTLRHWSVFFVTWFLQARQAPPLRISVVFRLPFECVLFDLGVHFGHCRIPPRDHFGIELQEFFWKLFIIRRCYLHVSLTPATQSVHHPSPLHHPPSVWELICKSESPSLERKGRRNSRRDNN